MSVIEIVTLRGTANLSEDFCETLLQQVLEQNRTSKQPEIHAYRQNNIETDLSFHLHWYSQMEQVEKSDVGIILADFLKGVGLVSHTVWLEEQAQPEFLNSSGC